MDPINSSSALPLTPQPASCKQASAAVAGGGRVFHGVARHHDSEYRGAGHLGGSACGSAEHEVGAGQLHLEPGGVHSDQRLDGGPVRNPPGVCLGDRPLHAGLLSLRHIERHSSAGRLPHPARLRRSHDGAGGPAHPGAHVCQIRAGPRHELRRHSGAGRPDAGTDRRRPDRRLLSLAVHLLRESSDRPGRACSWSICICRTIAKSDTQPLDIVGLSCSAPASRCCPMCWRSSASIR